MSAEANLKSLGLTLPPIPPPGGVYKPFVVVGELAYLSGHGPYQDGDTYITGRLGENMDLDAGYAAAKQTGLALLATMKNQLGSLDKVKRIIKLLGLVNCTADFNQQPQVINGCSELFRDVFGEAKGIGARSAIGANSLPGGIAVEIEAIMEIET